MLYSFYPQGRDCTDGAYLQASLIAFDGKLYGTTFGGGSGSGIGCSWPPGCGTVFSLDLKTGAETVVHSFTGYPSDGSTPYAGLIAVNGTLYGTTSGGGANCGSTGCGAVFSVDPTSGAEKVLYSFCSQPGCTDGAVPTASLIEIKGTLYGTTYVGGRCTHGCGTAFSVDPKTGVEEVIYSFCAQKNCADGVYPCAGLIDVNDTFYGTTAAGGAYRSGTVFALNKRR